MGIKNYEPQIVMQMTDLAHSLTKHILLEAQALSEFAGKSQIDRSDVEFAIKSCQEKFCPNRPSKMFLMELAAQKNNQPLLPIRQNYGLRLPNDRFCQVQPNFVYDDQSSPSSKEVCSANSQQTNSQRYNSNLSEMNTESVIMSLDATQQQQQQVKRRRLDDSTTTFDDGQNEENNDFLKDNYYD